MNNRFIPNSFQVSNIIVDDALHKMSGSAAKCYLLIVRKTIGWQKKYDAISMSQFMTSLNLNEKTVRRALKELSNMDLIRTQKSTGYVTKFTIVQTQNSNIKQVDKIGGEVKKGIDKNTCAAPSKNYNTQKTLQTDEEDVCVQEFKNHLDSFVEFLKKENGLQIKHPISFQNKLIANFKAQDLKTIKKYHAYTNSHYYVSAYVCGKYFNGKKILNTKINEDGFLCLIFNDEIMRIEKQESYAKLVDSVVEKD